MTIENFEDLRVWKKGIELTKQIYVVTSKGEISRDFGLRDQLRRAAVSIPTNIAEGFERYSRKEYVNFLNIAKGSAGEVRSLVRVALEVGYFDRPIYNELYNQAKELLAEVRSKGKGSREKECIKNLFPFPFNLSPKQDQDLLDKSKRAKDLSRMLASQIKAIKQSPQ
ncbi:MAG: four helix bundle protein [Xenococcaceae cyanobacterium]